MTSKQSGVKMESSFQNPKSSLRRKVHQIIFQTFSYIDIVEINNSQFSIWCGRPAPYVGWSLTVDVNVDMHKVIRPEEQVGCVLYIQEHGGGGGGIVLVPADMFALLLCKLGWALAIHYQ